MDLLIPTSPRDTTKFTGKADAYALYRPKYPTQAIEEALSGLGDPKLLAIVDIGAGTGIGTQQLRDTGARAIAVEPNDDMRRVAAAAGLKTIAGHGEATNLPDECCDVVTIFQAFHWFATQNALTEIRRILRPGGRLAIIGNTRDDADAFSSGYGDFLEKAGERALWTNFGFSWSNVLGLLSENGFSGGRRKKFPWAQPLTVDGLLGRAHSLSYMPARTDRKYSPLINALQKWHFQFADPAGFANLHFVTNVYLAEKQ